MKKIKVALPLVIGIFFLSCNPEEKWPENSKVEFNTNCVSSYIESFTASMGDLMSEVNVDKLNKIANENCACQYETIKNNYDSAEEAFKMDIEELATSIECEATDAQISDLLVK